MGLALEDRVAHLAPPAVLAVQQQYEHEIINTDGIYLWATGTAGTLVAMGLPSALQTLPDLLDHVPVTKIPSTRPFGCGGFAAHTAWPAAACMHTLGGRFGVPVRLNLAVCARVRRNGDSRHLVLSAGHCAVLPSHPPKWPMKAVGPEPPLLKNGGTRIGELVSATVSPSVDAAIFALSDDGDSVPEYRLARTPASTEVKLVTPTRSVTGTLIATASSIAEYAVYTPWSSMFVLPAEAWDPTTKQVSVASLRLRDPLVALFPEGDGLRPGESGSLLLDDSGGAIGLAVGGTREANVAICVPMLAIRDHFGLIT
eukprot:TRINITY_DN82087_c0_g1_i1.p1 TRINITY_DN82087_c0_g1~~TRINITY_DN82087_c0_g1_i1.p1  ORF type:complete len:313 (+),score=28.67 TRINITY_DN82087_c0_g1_i1:239-1177(+)